MEARPFSSLSLPNMRCTAASVSPDSREKRVRESFNGVYQVRLAESFQGNYTFMGLTSKLLLLELKNIQFRGCFRP